MIIAIDASRAVKEQPTGTELYSARLIEYLGRIDHTNTYYLYTPAAPPSTFPKLPPNFQWRVIPFPRLWTQIRLSIAILFDRPDILFVPAHVLPLIIPKKTVVTLHDMAFEVFPEAYRKFEVWYNRYAVRTALRRASQIITPSQSTKNDLVRVYNAPEEKITVIHLGFDPPTIDPDQLPAKITEQQPYFFMLGRLEARKNTARAIEAFAHLRELVPDHPVKLILAGKPGYGHEAVTAAIGALPGTVRHDIIELGYTETEEVDQYLAGATAFLYPSLYEGFGLPLLTAMSLKTPIITSDAASMPEIVDDAAILVDPLSTEAITEAMKVLLLNDLSGQQIAQRGSERVKAFSWQQTAEKTLSVLKEV